MPTINQLIRNGRQKKKVKTINPALEGCPYKKGVCVKIQVLKPRKPNSALRKVARVRLSNGKVAYAYIPGIGHNLQEHNLVLVSGQGVKDLPSIQLRLVRGKYDLAGVSGRKTSRSRYGVRKT